MWTARPRQSVRHQMHAHVGIFSGRDHAAAWPVALEKSIGREKHMFVMNLIETLGANDATGPFDDDVCLCIVSAAHCKSVSLLCHALGKLSETLVLYGRSYRTTFNCVLQQYFERVLSKVCWGRSAVVTMVFDLPFYYTECCLHHAFHCAEIVI